MRKESWWRRGGNSGERSESKRDGCFWQVALYQQRGVENDWEEKRVTTRTNRYQEEKK